MEPSILIVIPCYNEEKRLPIQEYTAFLKQSRDNIHLLFVDDGSTDNTQKPIHQLIDSFPEKVHLLSLTANRGKGGAIRQGMLSSLVTNYEFLAYMDADLATPLQAAEELTAAALSDEIVMVMGSRVDLFGSTTIKRSLLRHYFGRIFATLVSNLLQLKIYDTQCGAKVFRSKTVNQLFEAPFASAWLFDIEIILRLRRLYGQAELKKRMREVPLKSWVEKGSSKVGAIDLIQIPFQLLKLSYRYRM